MKAVLLSVRPKWCERIASRNKKLELRKTKPKISTPFKCYIYCTKPSKAHQTICGCMVLNSDELYRHPKKGIKHGDSIELMCCDDYTSDNFLNGKVIGEFVCDCIYEINEPYLTWLEEQSCVDMNDIAIYKGEKDLIYAWQITQLKVYDKPKALSEFNLTRAPQSWCYVEEI